MYLMHYEGNKKLIFTSIYLWDFVVYCLSSHAKDCRYRFAIQAHDVAHRPDLSFQSHGYMLPNFSRPPRRCQRAVEVELRTASPL